MKKSLTFALAFSCLALGLSQSSFAQDNVTRTPVSVDADSGNREQDGFKGPVRRVRVETAKIILKDGKWVEGSRELLGIATYDPAGKKIDSAAYPTEASILPGKEQYLYDDKGNIVEMTWLGEDGSVLSKESYKYEFDQLGNWTKMSSSVAVYENGKISFRTDRNYLSHDQLLLQSSIRETQRGFTNVEWSFFADYLFDTSGELKCIVNRFSAPQQLRPCIRTCRIRGR